MRTVGARTLDRLSALFGLATVVFTAASQAAPSIGTSKPTPSTPGERPKPTIDPRSRPHVVAARSRTGDNGLPITMAAGSALAFEVDVKNPTNAAARVTIGQTQTGGYVVDVPANTTKTVPIARGFGLGACNEVPFWEVWVEENRELKTKVKAEPNCVFKVTTPSMTAVQPPPGKLSYSSVQMKSAPRACGEPLLVEANVTNGTSAAVDAALKFPMWTAPVALAPGQTKSVSVGGGWTGWGDGQWKLTVVDTTNANNPNVAAGSWSFEITSTCRPAVSLAGFSAP